MSTPRLLAVLIAATVFGLVAGWIHGDQGGLRGGLGNLSAPWLLVAIVPSWWSGSWGRGVLVGLAATLAGLFGYYVAMTLGMRGHLGSIDGDFLHLLRYVMTANRIWFAAGVVSGPVCGAVSGAVGARCRAWWLGIAAGALMIGEVVVVRLVENVHWSVPLLGVRLGWATDAWGAYQIQALAGLLVAVVSGLVWARFDGQHDQ